MGQTNVRTVRVTVRLSEEEYNYLKDMKNRIACSTISEAVRHLIHKFKELEEVGYVVVSKKALEPVYDELVKIAYEEFKKELEKFRKRIREVPQE
jgi:predicted CopG family antitoxin